jgi:hypothetical protein
LATNAPFSGGEEVAGAAATVSNRLAAGQFR